MKNKEQLKKDSEFDDDQAFIDAEADRELKYGCLFPGYCCMPEPHSTSECYTPEMYQQYENEDEVIMENQEQQEQLKKDMEFNFYWNLCLIIEEITGLPRKDVFKKYKTIGIDGTIGVIIAEIRRRKYEGDKLRTKAAAYRLELSHLRQIEMFKKI